jgi:hypothetical protein
MYKRGGREKGVEEEAEIRKGVVLQNVITAG